MRKFLCLAFVFLAIMGGILERAWAADAKVRVVVVNPSKDKSQTKTVKSYLPKEVKLKDIKDAGGLEIDYDDTQGLFYAFKNDVPLAPLETKTFEVIIADIWRVPDDTVQNYRDRVDNIMNRLKNTPYYEQAGLVAKTIYGRLDEIAKTQNDEEVTRQQHIAYYRDNLKTIPSIEQDIEKLEKMLVTAGGPPNPQLLEKSDVNLKSPTTKTTWVIIFVIIIFVAILSVTFYFTWMRQASITENIFKKEQDSSFSEFKHTEGGGGSAPPGDEKKT